MSLTPSRRGRRALTAHAAGAALPALLADTGLQFLPGFTLGNVVGTYLAQNYDIPNLAKQLEEIKQDMEAKKTPPSSGGRLQHCLLDKLILLFLRASFTI
ncbi:hypothetical protein J1605_005457 [Eschrichtius robustus]|uniref:Uncharacterized protein n=1 Tax=Eschrichtius robustus TaxID=9764 RepID=A0AB34HA29_ESCRO|nr:hypothetical protein J1605_005457 [Eschrichtius robustus]